MGAAAQLGRVGDAGQLPRRRRVLSDARRALYLILAGQPDAAARPAASRATVPPDLIAHASAALLAETSPVVLWFIT